MLGKLFGKNKKIELGAPIAGRVISIKEVNDPTFSEELLGKGIAILPVEGRVVSPVSGVVTQMFDTGHAVTLTSEDGAEILIHVGLDTVTLKGQHYTPHVKDGDKVQAGDLLMEFDKEAILAAGYEIVTPIIVCNTEDYSKIEFTSGTTVTMLDPLITLQK